MKAAAADQNIFSCMSFAENVKPFLKAAEQAHNVVTEFVKQADENRQVDLHESLDDGRLDHSGAAKLPSFGFTAALS